MFGVFNVLLDSFCTFKCGLKDMREPLMHVFYAHISSPVEGLHGGDDVDECGVAADELVQALRRPLVLELGQQDVLHHPAAAGCLRCHGSPPGFCSRGPSLYSLVAFGWRLGRGKGNEVG
uniref:Uncharacterized protein n=1 Tax=Arundo donax TaxID=35708 RepID=A0A0A9H4I8_ARUDO